ncbi:MAG: FAD-dependent oxidoreductase [Ruminococcaceae bacterium]|nr:FAD-dependent oxidoreductase [Oscillospiraceae bacterium]
MKHYDVVVVGGGTAGAIAAIASARNNAKTLVVERYGHLGGTAVSGIPFLGVLSGNGKMVNTGLTEELFTRLEEDGFSFGIARNAYWNTPDSPETYEFNLLPFDPEGLKYVLQEMLCEAGGEILYYSTLSDVKMENGRLREIEVCSHTSKEWLSADVFIDCTGDASLVNYCGGEFIEKQHVQNSSILFHLGNVDFEAFRNELENGDRVLGKGTWHTRVVRKSKSSGVPETLVHMAGHLRPFDDDRTVTFTAVSYRDGEIYLNASRVPGIDGTDPWQMTYGEIAERRNVMNLVRAMKKNVPGFENVSLLSTSPLGIRESRNIVGDYIITRDDVLSGAEFDDGVARGAYPIDIHDPKGGKTQFQFIKDGKGYEIPFRAMLPKNIEGVITAGRCISADHNAIGTVRIMGCCLHQGVAAGVAAAMCIKENKLPRELNGAELKKILL